MQPNFKRDAARRPANASNGHPLPASGSGVAAVDTAIDTSFRFEAEAQMAQGVPEGAARVSGRGAGAINLAPTPGRAEMMPGRGRALPLLWRTALLAGDTLLVVSLLVLLLWLALHADIGWRSPLYDTGLPVWNAKLSWIVLALFSWTVALNLTRAQEMVYAADRFASILRTLLALVMMVAVWSGLGWLYFGLAVTRSLWLESLFFVLALPLLCGWRVLLFELMRLPPFRQRTVIVGVNAAGEVVGETLVRARRPAMQLLGYINERDDLPALTLGEHAWAGQNLAPTLDNDGTLRFLVKNNRIDTIIVAFDTVVNPSLYQEVIAAAQLGIAVLPMAVVYERLTGKLPVQHLGDQWYGVLPLERALTPWYLCWQKMVDMSLGVLGAAALLLMLPALALLISLDSPGPIFYGQERVGLRGKPFRILKFRSMRVDAEGAGNARWASANDARITRVGRFLRATHLDELPQVLNILRGEMSVIGPRPERQIFVEELERSIPLYRFRLSVKPGLTGWAQVKYPYASSTEDALHKLQYDLYYIKRRSVTLDIFILLKTVGEVLLSRGR